MENKEDENTCWNASNLCGVIPSKPWLYPNWVTTVTKGQKLQIWSTRKLRERDAEQFWSSVDKLWSFKWWSPWQLKNAHNHKFNGIHQFETSSSETDIIVMFLFSHIQSLKIYLLLGVPWCLVLLLCISGQCSIFCCHCLA